MLLVLGACTDCRTGLAGCDLAFPPVPCLVYCLSLQDALDMSLKLALSAPLTDILAYRQAAGSGRMA